MTEETYFLCLVSNAPRMALAFDWPPALRCEKANPSDDSVCKKANTCEDSVQEGFTRAKTVFSARKVNSCEDSVCK